MKAIARCEFVLDMSSSGGICTEMYLRPALTRSDTKSAARPDKAPTQVGVEMASTPHRKAVGWVSFTNPALLTRRLNMLG